MQRRSKRLTGPLSRSSSDSTISDESLRSIKKKKDGVNERTITKEEMARLLRVTQEPEPLRYNLMPTSGPVTGVKLTDMTKVRAEVADRSDFRRLSDTIADFKGSGQAEKLAHKARRDRFVSNVRKSVLAILREKLKKYGPLLTSAEEQMDKAKGSDYNDVVGILTTLTRNIKTAQSKANALVELLTSGLQGRVDDVATPDEIMLNQLQRVVFDREGISMIAGDSRAEERDQLARLVLPLESGPEFYTNGYFNMLILGGAGTGKTTIAQVIGFIMQNLFILFNGQIINATASNFISGYEGSTGNKTKEVLYSSIETVLFIDEAYGLATVNGAEDKRCKQVGESSESSSKKDALTEIVNFMDKFKSLYMIVAAGYTDVMLHCFLPSNEGLSRRFLSALRMDLKSYTAEDIGSILYSVALNQMGSSYGVPTGMLDYEWAALRDVLPQMKEAGVFKEEAGSASNLSSTLQQFIMINGDVFASDKIKSLSDVERLQRLGFIEKAVNKYVAGQGARGKFTADWDNAKKRWMGAFR